MNNRVFNTIFIFIALAYGGWFGFQSYINSHKVDSAVEKSETTVSGTQETSETGVTINNYDHLNGSYASQQTDPPTSEILFETFGATATQGTFKNTEISTTFSGSEQFSLNVNIDAASIYTAEATRDSHLQGEDFFNVASYSTITFVSNEIVKHEDGYVAKGEITFLGNTKALDIPFSYEGSAKGKENTEVFEGKFDFNPINYGLDSDAGDNVTVSFYTELTKVN